MFLTTQLEIVFFVVSLGLFGLVVFLWLQGRKQKQQCETQKQNLSDLNSQNQTLSIELKHAEKNLQDFVESTNSLNVRFESAFKGLAAEALELNNRQFLELAKQNLKNESNEHKGHLDKKYLAFESLINPLKLSLTTYQNQVQILEKERQKTFNQVETELKKVNEMNLKLSTETTALKNALKKPHVRGRWGEIQLKNCIDIAGMSEYVDVSFQNSTTLEEGRKLVPDMRVKMPGDKFIYVDAKTPLEAYIESLEAPNDELKKSEMDRHGQQVKTHIKQLSLKDYAQNLKSSVDFTIMFLPNESFLYAALESQPDIIEFALGKKILIATPPTLVGLLKVIRYGWTEQKLTENAKAISKTGKELHKRVCDFIESYAMIGKHLERAQSEYQLSFTRLDRRVLPQARKLESLGAKGTKDLPEGYGLTEEISSEEANKIDLKDKKEQSEDSNLQISDDLSETPPPT